MGAAPACAYSGLSDQSDQNILTTSPKYSDHVTVIDQIFVNCSYDSSDFSIEDYVVFPFS